MFFIRLGSLIAWLAVIAGLMQFGLGFLVASQPTADARAALALRYLGSSGSAGAMNTGLQVFLAGIVLGILSTVGNRVVRYIDNRE